MFLPLLPPQEEESFPCPSLESLTEKTVFHEFLQHDFFPWAAVLHKQLQCGSFSIAYRSSRKGCSSMGSLWGLKSCQETRSHRLLSPQGQRPCQEPAPAWASHRVTKSQLFFKHPPALMWGSPRVCRWISEPLWNSDGFRETACLTMVLIMSCKCISSMVPGAPSPPPLLALVSAVLVLSYILTFVFSVCNYFCTNNLSYLALLSWLMGSALAGSGSVLEELADIGLVGCGTSF